MPKHFVQNLNIQWWATKFMCFLVTNRSRIGSLHVRTFRKHFREICNSHSNKTWLYWCDSETKQVFTRRTRQVCSNVRSQLIMFFDIDGIVHQEFIPKGWTVNQKMQVLKWKFTVKPNCSSGMKRIVFYEFVPPKLTVNQELQKKCLFQHIKWKRTKFLGIQEDFASWQCAFPHITFSKVIFLKYHY